MIRRTEFVTYALAGLLLIAIVAVLYFAKAFFLPVVMAVVAGTMLSPAASFLERRHVPRALGAVLIVIAVTTLVAFVVALIAVPAMEWSSRLPELRGAYIYGDYVTGKIWGLLSHPRAEAAPSQFNTLAGIEAGSVAPEARGHLKAAPQRRLSEGPSRTRQRRKLGRKATL